MTVSLSRITLVLAVVLFAFAVAAETNSPTVNNAASVKEASLAESKEQIRARCIEGRRSICGRIIRIFPEGLLVEAGYTNLLREPLMKSWLVPATVTASAAPNLVETKEPGAICVGTVFLTDLPRGKPHLYDYVILAGYPTGEMTYTTVGEIKKTVRRFSANLDKAVTALATTAQSSSTKGK